MTDALRQPVIVSPHLDDAVLSCYSRLEHAHQPRVINVFTGLPPSCYRRPWDEITGSRDSRGRMEERIAEDRAALATCECLVDNLGFPLIDELPSEAELLAGVSALADPTELLLLPAAIGGHPHHRFVRDVCLDLRADFRVALYADMPYAVRYGWPTWVDPDAATPFLSAAAAWAQDLASAELSNSDLDPVVTRLDEGLADRKLKAMRMYRTQFAGLNEGYLRRLEHPLTRRYEVTWKVRSTDA